MNRDLMAQLGQMQEKLLKAQEDIANRVAEGTAGGGAVKVEITGEYKVKSVKIEPDVIDPDDPSMLEDLFTAAVNEALAQVQAFHAEPLAGLGGLGLSGMPGLPGAGGGGEMPQQPANRAARRAAKR